MVFDLLNVVFFIDVDLAKKAYKANMIIGTWNLLVLKDVFLHDLLLSPLMKYFLHICKEKHITSIYTPNQVDASVASFDKSLGQTKHLEMKFLCGSNK